MKRLKTLFTLSLLVFATAAFAQSKDLSKANKLYKLQKYAEAIPLFEKSLEEKASVAVNTRLAYSYKMTNQIDKAEKLYSDIVYADRPRAITFFYYGEALMSNGKYAAAKFWFEEYLKKKPNDATTMKLIDACDQVNLIKPYFGFLDVLPYPNNSELDDTAPVAWGDKIIFCSDRKQGTKLLKQKSGWTGRDFISLYQSQLQADGSYSEPESFTSKINGLNKNTGPISFNADGSFAVFSRNSDIANKQDAFTMQLYQAELVGDKWKNVEALDFCNPEFNYMHPALSPDGSKLFFVSDRSGGQGGTEIYLSEKNGDGIWSKPANLGATINTEGHDGFPFYDTEGRLFFSSKGHMGFGGFDIFYSVQEESGEWTTPTNVGFPVNSSSDDISIYLNPNGQSGMFTSSRNKAGDDIFLFTFTDSEPAESEANPVAVNTTFPDAEEETSPKGVEPSSIVEPVRESAPEEVAIIEMPATDTPVNDFPETETTLAEVINTEVINTEAEIYSPETEVVEIITEPETIESPVEEEATSLTDLIAESTEDPLVESTPETVEINIPKAEVTTPSPDVSDNVEEMPNIEIEIPATTEVIAEQNISEPVENQTSPVEEEEEFLSTIIETAEPTIIEEEVIVPETESRIINESPRENADMTIITTETNPSEIIEPERLSQAPETLEEIMNIEASDQSNALVLPASNDLLEFDLDLSNKNISFDKSYLIPNVDYPFNASAVTLDMTVALDELAKIMNKNPQIEVQLIGHTASFGNTDKNQSLSESRAKAAVDYLIQKGVERHRVNPAGFGESQLLNECVDGILCSIDQHKVNERLELKVVRY